MVKLSGTAEDFHKLGKSSTTKHYRGILLKVKAQDEDIEKKHQAELEKYSISDQMELLDVMAQKGCLTLTSRKRRTDSRRSSTLRKRSGVRSPACRLVQAGEVLDGQALSGPSSLINTF
ncbi:hypothetical protein Bca4012_020501 [Brassica carinata]